MFGVEFRPLDFKSVLGLEDVKNIFKSILQANHYDPAYLLIGDYSSGKTTLGKIFARSVFCENRLEDMSPCNECPSCRAFLADRNTGFLEIDAANHGSKEMIKDLKESLAYESVTQYKIILFDECHSISKEGKDALLKQLEQKDSNVIFIFCTTEADKMPSTLRSRCMEFYIQQPTEKNIYDKLSMICKDKSIEHDEEALHLIIRSSGRHYRDAENKLRQVSLLGKVSEENVSKVVNNYDEQIAEMLVKTSTDLSKAIQVCNELVSRTSIKVIYDSILRLIVDSLKYLKEVRYSSERYNQIIEMICREYGTSLFQILDFIISKNRFTDLTFLQSDILLIHYKLARGGFEVSAEKPSPVRRDVSSSTKRDSSSKESPESLTNFNKGDSWDRSDAVRNMKKSKRSEKIEDKVSENVSAAWGPDVDKTKPSTSFRKDITSQQFQKIVAGGFGEDKI